jgi:hypothetical protein
MNNSSNNIGIPDGTIYINGTGNDPYYEESHRCHQEIRDIKTSVEERLDNSNTSQSSEELPVEQYKLQGIEPIEFIKTLEKLKKELKLAEIQDEKIRTDFANKAVTGYCKATEKFYRNKEDLKQASILKVVGWSLLLVIINFILSRTLNLAELVSSANLTGVFNFLVALSPLAVIGGISFIEYVQYEAKDGELISAYAQKNGELLEKLKSERNKISNNQLTIPKGLGYHPNPETEYKLPPKDTAIVNRLNKQQLLRLKDALLGTRRTQKITNHPKKPEGHMKVLKPNSTNKPQE